MFSNTTLIWLAVKCFKFYGAHITEDLSWSFHTSTVVKTGGSASSTSCQAMSENVNLSGLRPQPPNTWTVLHATIRQAVLVHQGSDRLLNRLLSPGHKTVKWLTTTALSLSHRLSTLALCPPTCLYPLRHNLPCFSNDWFDLTPLRCCPLIIDCHYH
jgi:hypothetical protein